MEPYSIVPGNHPPPDAVAAHEPAAARLPRANPHEVAHILRGVGEDWARLRPVTDTEAWKAVAARLAPDTLDRLVATGRAAARRPVTPLTASQWRTYTRTGDRTAYEKPWYERRTALADLLVAYTLAPDGDVLDALVDMLWATCEETSWSFPACYAVEHPLELPDPEKPIVCLFSALTGVGLAESLHILRPVLPAELVARIEREVTSRVIDPYLEDDHWGWLYNRPDMNVNNWTAVCGFGAVGAACYLVRDEKRLATILCKAARSMEEYLQTFDPDGATSEGPSYWSFGFGSFCQLADLVERRTGGTWDWFGAPIVERVARFPLDSRITVDSWPTFSDCDAGARFPGPLLVLLSERFAVPGLMDLAGTPSASWTWKNANGPVTQALRSLAAGTTAPPRPMPLPEPSTWFRGVASLTARVNAADPETLAVAVKGGHNRELHNQNDIGSLIVRVGGEDLVVDPGRGLYTRDYFNEHRYEFFVNRSFGHSVPRPAGLEQAEGLDHRAAVLALDRSKHCDQVAYDLTGAYPSDGGELRLLKRTVALHRGDLPRVELTDAFAFAAPATAESAFVTFGEVTVEAARVVIRGERAALAISLPAGTTADVHTEDVQLAFAVRRTSRIAVRPVKPAESTVLSFVLTPL
ncbi:hypothetical protein ACFWRV_22695 [Streptomyces sp. NPDC058576]|uniref:hypothetical protein n=1 Tax=Streptomyces sp. NPDC058576 TaxID=3346547 RepID=UPI003647445C